MTNPRTSMDPQLDDDATGTSHVPTSNDPHQVGLFVDIHPENVPDDVVVERPESIPTNAEGRECRPDDDGSVSRVLGGAP